LQNRALLDQELVSRRCNETSVRSSAAGIARRCARVTVADRCHGVSPFLFDDNNRRIVQPALGTVVEAANFRLSGAYGIVDALCHSTLADKLLGVADRPPQRRRA
jgi:hypothetical protein